MDRSSPDDDEGRWYEAICVLCKWSCDLIVLDCVATAKSRLDDLLLRMMRCELDDFEIVSK